MDKDTLAAIMLVLISGIVIVTLVLWTIEKALHWDKLLSAPFKSASVEGDEEDESDDDPYDVGMNDKDIL